MSNFYTNPAFLDVKVNGAQPSFTDTSQAGPSNYSRPSSSGENYLQQSDDADALLKMDEAREVQDEQVEGVEEEEGGEMDNEEPLYVNAKQYHRILKRRAARQRLEELNRLARSRKVSSCSFLAG